MCFVPLPALLFGLARPGRVVCVGAVLSVCRPAAYYSGEYSLHKENQTASHASLPDSLTASQFDPAMTDEFLNEMGLRRAKGWMIVDDPETRGVRAVPIDFLIDRNGMEASGCYELVKGDGESREHIMEGDLLHSYEGVIFTSAHEFETSFQEILRERRRRYPDSED